MYRIVIIFIITIFISACNNETSEKKPDTKKVVNRYVNGIAQLERNYVDKGGKLVANYEWEYYEDGSVLKEGPLSAQENRDGLWKSYYRNGVVWSEGEYKNGIREGKTITYHSNGNMYYDGQFIQAKKAGLWKFYKENGDFDYEMFFDHENNTMISVDTEKLKEQLKSME